MNQSELEEEFEEKIQQVTARFRNKGLDVKRIEWNLGNELLNKHDREEAKFLFQ